MLCLITQQRVLTCRAWLEKRNQPSLYCVRPAVGHSPGKEIRHLPGRWSLLHSHRFCSICEYTKGDWTQQGNLSPCWQGRLAWCSRGAPSHTPKVAPSYTHNCLLVLIELQRSLNRQQCRTLPVLAGLPSLQWHCSSLCGPFKIQSLSADYFQIPTSPAILLLFFYLLMVVFLFQRSQHALSLGPGIIIVFKEMSFC